MELTSARVSVLLPQIMQWAEGFLCIVLSACSMSSTSFERKQVSRNQSWKKKIARNRRWHWKSPGLRRHGRMRGHPTSRGQSKRPLCKVTLLSFSLTERGSRPSHSDPAQLPPPETSSWVGVPRNCMPFFF